MDFICPILHLTKGKVKGKVEDMKTTKDNYVGWHMNADYFTKGIDKIVEKTLHKVFQEGVRHTMEKLEIDWLSLDLLIESEKLIHTITIESLVAKLIENVEMLHEPGNEGSSGTTLARLADKFEKLSKRLRKKQKQIGG